MEKITEKLREKTRENRRSGSSIPTFLIFALLVEVMSLLVVPTSRANDAKKPPRVIYSKKTELDFDGAQIEGEVRNPGEFYFQHRPEEKFDSLIKRRKNFHREMMRDVVLSK